MSKLIVAVLVVLLLPAHGAFGQTRKFRVALAVEAPENVSSRFQSSVLAELRKHPDFLISERPDAIFLLSVLCANTRGGATLVCSAIGGLINNLASQITLLCPKPEASPSWPSVSGGFPSYMDVRLHAVYSRVVDQLDELSAQVAADFDITVMEPVRKEGDSLDRLIEEAKRAQEEGHKAERDTVKKPK
jgi:hypothetical protein